MSDDHTADDHTADATTEGAAAQGGERPADTPTPGADNSRAVAVVAKQRIIATSDVAIWDTAAFEHMGRVGRVMAESGLMSDTFKDGVDEIGLVARCVMVANLAREVGANPLMLLQTCSIISKKLHLEGKAVAAIVTARTGVRLRYRFGKWDPAKGEIAFPDDPLDAEFFRGAADLLAVRCFDPGDAERFVDGYVKLWRTDRKGNPWENPANWRRQLRYRSAPEWARAYEPGAILGFYSDADEDLEEIGHGPAPRERRPLRANLEAGKAAEGGKDAGGFDRAHVARETGEESNHARQPDDDVAEGEFEDKAADEATGNSQGADPKPEGGEGEGAPVEAPAELVAQAGELAHISPLDEDETDILVRLMAARRKAEAVTAGHAEAGETYLIAGDEFTVEGRRLTFRDGARYSTVTASGAAKLKAYAIHAPEKAGEEGEGERPTGTDNARSAGAGPATSGSASPASEASPETKAFGPSDTAAPTSGGEPASGEGFLASLRPMTEWPAIKAAFIAMNKTGDWIQAPDAEKDEVRRAVWAEVERVRADHDAKVDQALDVSAFGLWLTTQSGRDGADAIDGTFNVLKTQEVWSKLKEEQRATVEGRVAAKLKALRG